MSTLFINCAFLLLSSRLCVQGENYVLRASGQQFKYYTEEALTWHEAKERCEQDDAYLARAMATEDQYYIGHLTEDISKKIWLGANDIDQEDSWVWVGGDAVVQNHWLPEQPDNFQTENCLQLGSGFVASGFSWNDLPCLSTLPFICEKGYLRTASGQQFKYYAETMTWSEAKAKCEEDGAYLARAMHAEDQNYIASLTHDSGAWLGASDKTSEGEWVWIGGNGVTQDHWDTGSPDNFGTNEHCMQLKYGSFHWNDYTCSNKIPFICEKDILLCPHTHPYAYDEGKSCCKYDKDCNGDQILLSSSCCQNNAYTACTDGKEYCRNNPYPESLKQSNAFCPQQKVLVCGSTGNRCHTSYSLNNAPGPETRKCSAIKCSHLLLPEHAMFEDCACGQGYSVFAVYQFSDCFEQFQYMIDAITQPRCGINVVTCYSQPEIAVPATS